LGIHRVEQSRELNGSPEACFAAITDYESFTDWQSAVRSVEIIDRHPDGLARTVSYELDAKVRRIAYTLEYSYEPPGRIVWEFVDGSGIDHIEGGYRFEPIDDGARTIATYTLGIDPGVRVPGLLARRLNSELMKRSVGELADEVERRVVPRRAQMPGGA
jgi:ribosome-associated toxin RatA of RatAB toxin-antitoxin module